MYWWQTQKTHKLADQPLFQIRKILLYKIGIVQPKNTIENKLANSRGFDCNFLSPDSIRIYLYFGLCTEICVKFFQFTKLLWGDNSNEWAYQDIAKVSKNIFQIEYTELIR